MDTISINNIGLLFDIAGVVVIAIHSFVVLSHERLKKINQKNLALIFRQVGKRYLPEKERPLSIKCDLMVGTFMLIVGFLLQLVGSITNMSLNMIWFYTALIILICFIIFYILVRRRFIYWLGDADYPG